MEPANLLFLCWNSVRCTVSVRVISVEARRYPSCRMSTCGSFRGRYGNLRGKVPTSVCRYGGLCTLTVVLLGWLVSCGSLRVFWFRCDSGSKKNKVTPLCPKQRRTPLCVAQSEAVNRARARPNDFV